MTPYETRSIDDALWYLRHGNSEGALSILRELHREREQRTATSMDGASRSVPRTDGS